MAAEVLLPPCASCRGTDRTRGEKSVDAARGPTPRRHQFLFGGRTTTVRGPSKLIAAVSQRTCGRDVTGRSLRGPTVEPDDGKSRKLDACPMDGAPGECGHLDSPEELGPTVKGRFRSGGGQVRGAEPQALTGQAKGKGEAMPHAVEHRLTEDM